MKQLVGHSGALRGRRNGSLTSSLVEQNADLWEAMAKHPWVRAFADGSIPEQAFIAWAQQCRLFCIQEGRALSILRATLPPPELDGILAQLIDDTVREPRQLADTLTSMNAPIPLNPWPVCLGYSSHVLAAAAGGLLEGAVAVLAVERAYRDTWQAARKEADPNGRWFSWVENWTNPEFSLMVDDLGQCVDALAGTEQSAVISQRLRTVFRQVALWEHAFWQMCWDQQCWPALEGRDD